MYIVLVVSVFLAFAEMCYKKSNLNYGSPEEQESMHVHCFFHPIAFVDAVVGPLLIGSSC